MEKLLYVYGLIPAQEMVHESDVKFRLKRHGDILAVFDDADPQVFSQQTIDQHIGDPGWVKEQAVLHHNAIAMLQQRFTVIPLKFCTIFADETSLETMLNRHNDEIVSLFSDLQGKEEWNLKIYCDKEKLKSVVMQSNNTIAALMEEMSGLSPGKQFLMKKKINASLELEIEHEMSRICMGAHERLSSAALKEAVKKMWGRNVTGRNEDMAWNGVYLLEREKSGSFLRLTQQFGDEFQGSGFSFEVSGPWPVYHFARDLFGGNAG